MRERVLRAAGLAWSLLAAAAMAAPTTAPRDSLIWVSEEAAIDSLNAYWRELDTGWYEPLTPEMLSVDLDPASIDSLGVVGADALRDPDAGRRWRVSISPVGRTAFNRVEGLRPGVKLGVRRPGRLQPRLELGAGYGVASRAVVADASLTWPLLFADPRAVRRRAAAAAGAGKERGRVDDGAANREYKPAPRPWALLTLELAGERRVRAFAGEVPPDWLLQAMFGGTDPNQYYEARGARAALLLRPRPWLDVRGGGLYEEHRSLPLGTTWLLLGNRNDVKNNLGIEALDTRAVTAGLGLRWRRLETRGDVEWHRVTGAPWLARLDGAPDHAAFRRLRLSISTVVIDRAGDEFVLSGTWQAVDRAAPLQWQTWLGDYGTLRGYGAAEIAGDRGGWASLDIRWGHDPLKALHVPLLGRLGLQPITFIDHGVTEVDGGGAHYALPVDAPFGLPRPCGRRTDVGVGLGKLLGVPGARGNLRLYAARPVFDGHGDRPWMFTIAFEP